MEVPSLRNLQRSGKIGRWFSASLWPNSTRTAANLYIRGLKKREGMGSASIQKS